MNQISPFDPKLNFLDYCWNWTCVQIFICLSVLGVYMECAHTCVYVCINWRTTLGVTPWDAVLRKDLSQAWSLQVGWPVGLRDSPVSASRHGDYMCMVAYQPFIKCGFWGLSLVSYVWEASTLSSESFADQALDALLSRNHPCFLFRLLMPTIAMNLTFITFDSCGCSCSSKTATFPLHAINICSWLFYLFFQLVF